MLSNWVPGSAQRAVTRKKKSAKASDAYRRAILEIELLETRETTASITSFSVLPNPAAFAAAVTIAVDFTIAAPGPGSAVITDSVGPVTVFTQSGLATGSYSFSLAYTPAAQGSHTFTLDVTDTTGGATATAPLTVSSAYVSSTALTSSAPTAVFGQPLTYTATVTSLTSGSPAPTGTVTFTDTTTSTVLGTTALSGSTAALVDSSLAVGNHTIDATFNPAAASGFSGSSAPSIVQTVTQAGSQVAVTSSLNPSNPGASVTFTANVSAALPSTGTPTGSVSFLSNGTVIAPSVALTAGSATFTTSSLATGSDAITVDYSGDTNFTTSTSPALTQTVSQPSASVTLSTNPNPSAINQSVTLTAAVAAVAPATTTPTGSVSFMDGTTNLGTVTLPTNSLSTSTLAQGTHTLTAVYSGDSNYAGVTSAPVTQNVQGLATTTGLAATPVSPINLGQSVQLNATVTPASPGTPTGTVTFQDNSTTVGTAPLSSSGTATLTANQPTAGNHNYTAQYGGDSNFAASATTSAVPYVVNQSGTTTTLSASSNPAIFGYATTIKATIASTSSPAPTVLPTGTVTFTNTDNLGNVTTIGTGTVTNGVATVSTRTLPKGKNTVTASYSGDTNYTASTTTPTTQLGLMVMLIPFIFVR